MQLYVAKLAVDALTAATDAGKAAESMKFGQVCAAAIALCAPHLSMLNVVSSILNAVLRSTAEV